MDENCKVLKGAPSGGGLQEQYFLTEFGLYELLAISRKPIAKKFRNWVWNVIKEIRLSGEYKLKQELIEKNLEIQENNQQIDLFKKIEVDTSIKHHNKLIDLMDKKLCVYFGRITDIVDGIFLLKIGETGDLRQRDIELTRNYKTFILLDVIEVTRSKLFEKFLHHYPIINEHTWDEPVNGHVSKEHFKINAGLTLETVLSIAKRNVKDFQSHSPEVIINHEDNHVKLRQIAFQEQMLQSFNNGSSIQDLHELEKIIQRMDVNYKPQFTPPDYTKELLPQQNTDNHPSGPRIQKIDPFDFKRIIETFEGYTDTIRKHTILMSVHALKISIEACTEYKGFRWNAVPRDKNVHETYPIKPTVVIKHLNYGPIARLNYSKTEVLEVYENQKIAMQAMGFSTKSRSALSIAISKGTESKGSFWILWSDCEDTMKEYFIRKNGEPKFEKNQQYQKICVENKQIVGTYTSKSDIVKKCKLGHNTVSRIIETGENYYGFVYKFIEK